MGEIRATDPKIQYTTTEDGVRIAFFTLGAGPPLVHMPPLPLSPIRAEWQGPSCGPYYKALATGRMLVRYDRRGAGLSDRNVDDLSLERTSGTWRPSSPLWGLGDSRYWASPTVARPQSHTLRATRSGFRT